MAKKRYPSADRYAKSAKYAAKMERYYHNLYLKRIAEEQAAQERKENE